MSSDPPLIRFAAPDISEADERAVLRALRSGWLSTGVESNELEAELAAYCGAPHAVALSSCSAALEIAVASLRLHPGARVGVPTWTFAATAQAATHNGSVPMLLDVDPSTLNVAVDAVEAAVADLDALIVVHFGGAPVDATVLEIAAAAGVPVIEDAAHALGATDHRGPVAGRSTVGACFSFYATKNLTSAEGGALVTDDAGLAEFARTYRAHGMTDEAWRRYEVARPGGYDIVENGRKANLPDVLAALARSQLARFDALQARRHDLAQRYRAALGSVGGVDVVPARRHPGSADHLMVVTLPETVDRDAVAHQLRSVGVVTHVHFSPLHRYTWFAANAPVGPTGVGHAERLADRVLSLPLHPGLDDDDVDRVVGALAAAVIGGSRR